MLVRLKPLTFSKRYDIRLLGMATSEELSPQAESELSDKAKREELDAVIHQARVLILKALNLPLTTQDDDPKLKSPIIIPPFKAQLRQQSKDLLIDEEVRRRK